MPKISALPPMTSPDGADPAPVVDDSATTTKKMTLAQVRDWLYSLVNIPAGPASPVTRDSEHFFDHVASGLVITGDSLGSNRNASMSAGVCYINGRRISLSTVSARTYTASRDTYVDVLDNQDGTGTVVYTEVTNNNASPSLAANSIRIGIVVTGASNIAAAGSINQGQEDRILPIASSIPYAVTDSLGNLICSRDPNRKLLACRQLTSVSITTSTTGNGIQITGLSVPFINPLNGTRKLKISIGAAYLYNTTSGSRANAGIWDGTVGSGTQLLEGHGVNSNGASANSLYADRVITLSSGLHTLNGSIAANSAGTAAIEAMTTIMPIQLRVEMIG